MSTIKPMRTLATLATLATLLAGCTAHHVEAPGPSTVAQKVAAKATERLGTQWAGTAVRLSKIESGHRCSVRGPRTRHGRAVGPLQVLPSSARALGHSLRTCDQQIAAGIAHMERCIAYGVQTHQQMAACHVAGFVGWRTRLRPWAERYKQQYIRLATR